MSVRIMLRCSRSALATNRPLRRNTATNSSNQATGAAIGTPVAARGSATNSRKSCRTSRTVRLGSLSRSCHARGDARLGSRTEARRCRCMAADFAGNTSR